MTDLWVVVLDDGKNRAFYGPIEDDKTADDFAEFVTAQVDPATAHKLRSPAAELLSWYAATPQVVRADVYPEFWPPKPGQIWQDRDKNRWICTRTTSGKPYLVCIASQGDDSAEEIWRRHGPMSFVYYAEPTEGEVPF